MGVGWLDRVFGCLLVLMVAVLVVLICVLPSRYSDGRLADDVARRMYDAEMDDGGGW